MKVQQIKFNNKTHNYSILIGKNIFGYYQKKLSCYVLKQERLP